MATHVTSAHPVLRMVLRLTIGESLMAGSDDPLFLGVHGAQGREFRIRFGVFEKQDPHFFLRLGIHRVFGKLNLSIVAAECTHFGKDENRGITFATFRWRARARRIQNVRWSSWTIGSSWNSWRRI